jgi:hypothetical protein
MFRKTMIALVAATFAGALMASTAADARGGGGHGGGFGGGGMRGGGFGGGGMRAGGFGGGMRAGGFSSFRGGPVGVRSGFIARGPVGGGPRFVGSGIGRAAFVGSRFNRFGHRRFLVGAPFIGAGFYAGYPYGYGYGYDDCLVRQPVWTPWGYQYRLVNVCY